MSEVATLTAPVNGAVAPTTGVNELLEYEKILKLRDTVFAGSHPRLTVPANLIRKPSPRPTKALSPPPASVPFDTSSRIPVVQLPGLLLNSTSAEAPAAVAPFKEASSLNHADPPAPLVSELDPIFLTKPDVVLRAEIQLQRQRIERNLREQLERKRNDARHKTSLQEAKPDFDVSDVMSKALEIAKPVTFETSHNGADVASSSDSIDENSFYSSKAPDSTPPERRSSPIPKNQAPAVVMEDADGDEVVDQRADEVRQGDATDSPYKVIPRPNFQGGRPFSQPQTEYSPSQANGREAGPLQMPIDNDEDEPEYFPPEPIENVPVRSTEYYSRRPPPDDYGRQLNSRHLENGGRRMISPLESDMRIVRNHIDSPVAPQPSRITSLAITETPRLVQERRASYVQTRPRRDPGHDSIRTSPDTPSQSVQPIQPRKRRKLDGKRVSRKRGAGSPDIMIKDEPVSPPPFHESKPLGSARSRQMPSRPILIDDDPPPQEVHYLPSQTYVGPSAQAVYDPDRGLPRSEPRALPRAGWREAPPDYQDLRKVASLQHMRETQQAYDSDSVLLTPSRQPQATMEYHRQPVEAPQYQEGPRAYSQVPRAEATVIQSPVYREPEFGPQYEARAPPPTQKRIVVDEYGNEFYEIVRPPRTVSGPRVIRQDDHELFTDRTGLRNGSVRPASVIREPFRQDRQIHEMAPPQITYRRVTDVPKATPTEVRVVPRDQFDPRTIQRSASVQVIDYSPRQQIYVGGRAPPREIIRMSSVRPTHPGYNEEAETVQRVQSVHPQVRESSVFIDDQPQVRREYVPVRPPTYEIRQPAAAGYYHDEDGSMVLDGTAERGRYVSERYL